MTVISHFFWGWYVFRYRSWVWRFAGGAALPDLPYLALLGYYSWRLHVNGFADLGGGARRSALLTPAERALTAWWSLGIIRALPKPRKK